MGIEKYDIIACSTPARDEAVKRMRRSKDAGLLATVVEETKNALQPLTDYLDGQRIIYKILSGQFSVQATLSKDQAEELKRQPFVRLITTLEEDDLEEYEGVVDTSQR